MTEPKPTGCDCDISDTLQIYLGSLYANDFNRFGRTYQLTVQADQFFHHEANQIGQLKVCNNQGEMIEPMPLRSAVAGVIIAQSDNNIFTQIGLIVLVGLACKNAILIVELPRMNKAEAKRRSKLFWKRADSVRGQS